jgi:hypothetical protein
MIQRGLLGENEIVLVLRRVGLGFGEDQLNFSGGFDILASKHFVAFVSVTVIRFQGKKVGFRLTCSDLTISLVETIQTYPIFDSQLFLLMDPVILGSHVFIAIRRNVGSASRYENPGNENTRVNSWQSRSNSDHRALQGGGKTA